MPWWRDGVWICMDDVWMMYGWHGQQRTDMGWLFAIGSNGWMNLFTGNYYQLFVRLGCHRITRCSPGMRLILSHIWSLYREMCFFDLLKLPQLNWIMMVKFYTIGNPYRYAYILFFAVVVFFVEWKKILHFQICPGFPSIFPICLTHQRIIWGLRLYHHDQRLCPARRDRWSRRVALGDVPLGRSEWDDWQNALDIVG